MAKCPRCQARKGKRLCPALGAEICSHCCGTQRFESIQCLPDCPYLAGERYQHTRRRERANAHGKAFVDRLASLFTTEDRRKFAFYLQADIFWWMREHGRLTNERCAQALEELRSRLSAVFVPPSRPEPLAQFLHALVTETRHYLEDMPPTLPRERRLRCIALLAAEVRRHGDAGGFSYHEELNDYFGQLEFEADLDHSPGEELAKARSSDKPQGYREGPGGLLLPGAR
ncbi:MAG: hypothetical protein JXA90_14110 [Planctomycetes bacterium]|nr:hypothetical protein [Planctomycetota bacterium]